MRLLFSLLFFVTFNAHASAFLHSCEVMTDESNVEKVDVARSRGALYDTLSVYFTTGEVESYEAESHADVGSLEYMALNKSYALVLDETNEDGEWLSGYLYYGENFESRLLMSCR